METVGAYEAKTHLSELLERVREGISITITKHGVPIAILQPFEPNKHIDVRSTITAIRKFRAKNRLSGLSIREMIEEGRS
jgi:prevent-host-death family protein